MINTETHNSASIQVTEMKMEPSLQSALAAAKRISEQNKRLMQGVDTETELISNVLKDNGDEDTAPAA